MLMTYIINVEYFFVRFHDPCHSFLGKVAKKWLQRVFFHITVNDIILVL
jgi:hypothetical protein